ncbi:MAG: hypothetical protein JNK38_01030 [Acidobacteria bacterium]|nr:hypothetical protein [Acidobacteriota bacterium]
MLRNLLALECIGNRHWPGHRVAVTEIGAMATVPELSEVQQARQVRIHRQGAALVRGGRATARLESRATGALTERQDQQLRLALQVAEEARLRTVVQNFQTRQDALRMAA